jgi:hypothetical protein
MNKIFHLFFPVSCIYMFVNDIKVEMNGSNKGTLNKRTTPHEVDVTSLNLPSLSCANM